MKRISVLVTLTFAADLLSVDPSLAQTQTQTRVTVDTIVASGFNAAVQLTHAGDETNRLGVTLILTPIIANCVSARHCREP